MPLTRSSHALFDLDGVLLDTERLYTEATQAVVAPFGKRYDWSLKRHMMGRDARWTAAFLVENLALPLTPEEFLTRRTPILEELLGTCSPMPGAEGFVAELARRAVPMAIATSSVSRLFLRKTSRFAWFSAFQAVVCGDDPRVLAPKPSPDIFRIAASELGVTADRCVVFEDSRAGVDAALAAGARVVAIPDPALDPADFGLAHHVVRSFEEATGLLDELLD